MLTKSDIKTICKKSAEALFKVNLTNPKKPAKEKIVFPYYYDRNNNNENNKKPTKRISEQELRLIFCKTILDNGEYYLAIENPTENRYADFSKKDKMSKVFFDNSNGRSASIDICIYDDKPKDDINHPPRSNVEFKAHNVTINNVAKDLLKLVAEEGNGVFFHLLKSINNGTLTVNCSKKGSQKGVLTKYNVVNNYIKTDNIKKRDNIKEESILFVICSLDPELIMTRWVEKKALLTGKIDFCIDYEITSESKEVKKVEIKDLNNWERLDDKV